MAVEESVSQHAMIKEVLTSNQKRKYESKYMKLHVQKTCSQPLKNTSYFILKSFFTENSSHIVNIRNTIPNSAKVLRL